MKTLISIVVSLVLMYLVFFQLDPYIINSIMDALPETGNIVEWFKIIKIGLWVLLITLTGGLSIGLSIMIGSMVRGILGVSNSKKKLRQFRR